jgi:lipid-A-disaccharide synthase
VKYYLIAGERSGDLHGGNLIKAIKRHDQEATFKGFGGDEMQAEGMEVTVHYRQLAFMGFISLVSNLFTIYKYIAQAKAEILSSKPDVVVLIDYGGFNRKIAMWAKKNNIRVFYYIAPKVWAWYQKRALHLKHSVDRMFVILPFEKDFFKKFDWDVDYVGNPVLDAIKTFTPDPQFAQKNELVGKDVVALLPGSRKIELARMIPLMTEIVKLHPEFHFAVAAVNSLPKELYAPLSSMPNVKMVMDASYDLLSLAKAAIVTSGTATLETGIFKVPQVVVYKMGGLEYQIASRLVKVEFISLVNLIADKEVVKELIQVKATVNAVSHELRQLMSNSNYTEVMLQEYDRIYKILDTGSASDNAGRLMVKYLKG